MSDEYISRAKALADFESCNAENPNVREKRERIRRSFDWLICDAAGRFLQPRREKGWR